MFKNIILGEKLDHIIFNSFNSDEVLTNGVSNIEIFLNGNLMSYIIIRSANETNNSTI